MDALDLVLIQPKVHYGAVDMLRDGLIGWLVLAANGQPYKALFALYEPAIPPHTTYVSQKDYGHRPEEGTLHHASITSS